MLNFEQFHNELSDRCRMFAEEEGGIRIFENQVTKLSGSYPSLTMMRDGRDMGVAFNLNQLYGMYCCNMDLDEIFSYMKDHMDDDVRDLDCKVVLDYEQIRNLLFVRVSNAKANAYLLNSVPHRIIEEFALTYHVQVLNEEDVLGSAMVTYQLLENYGIDEEQLYQDAMVSAQKLFAPDVKRFSALNGWNMLMVTNTKQLNGAAVMFYPGFMDRLLEKVNEDLYVVPSSMHEMMLFPVSLGFEVSFLKQLLHDANRDCVSPGETLSENVYFLSQKDHTLRRIDC